MSNPRPFKCSWDGCDKGFPSRASLLRHRRVHTNNKPYECLFDGCTAKFVQKSSLVIHERTHTGEKPIMCAFEGCNARFADGSSYVRHKKIHEGLKVLLCETCNKKFFRKESLDQHNFKVHQKPNHSNLTEAADSSMDYEFENDVLRDCETNSNIEKYNSELIIGPARFEKLLRSMM